VKVPEIRNSRSADSCERLGESVGEGWQVWGKTLATVRPSRYSALVTFYIQYTFLLQQSTYSGIQA